MKKISALLLAVALLLSATTAFAATGIGAYTTVTTTGATADKNGSVSVNTTICALTVDENGIITGISFDAIQPKGTWDATGAATCDESVVRATKKELKEGYGMVKASAIGKEWYEQAAALEAWCIGKTVEEVVNMPTYDKGDGHHDSVPTDADLATGCTISVGDLLKALLAAQADLH